MLEVNLESINQKYRVGIQNIESKPHMPYIRYLLTKRYSPMMIRQELLKLALSAPHEDYITAYYLSVIDPIVKMFGVGTLYSEYKNKMLNPKNNRRGAYSKDILNYHLHIDDDFEMQIKFQKFIKYLGVADLWLGEIYRYHGDASRMPVDENGERILDCTSAFKNTEKILLFEKRYLIDRLLLENVTDSRIAEYCKTKLNFNVNRYDIACYKRVFFNIKTADVEDKIKYMIAEKESLMQLLKDLDLLDEYRSMSTGERMTIIVQSKSRIKELEENISSLNAMYSECAHKVAINDRDDYLGMFSDIVVRAYKRFTHLDESKDRDVVDPLIKTAKMMGSAYDKVESIKDRSKESINTTNTDMHSQSVVMQLYKQRIDEVANEQIKKANEELEKNGYGSISSDISPEDILGVEELGTNIETED